MKNFIDNILAYIVGIIVLVIAFAIGVLVGATVMSHGGDIFTSLAAMIVMPVGIIEGLANLL